MKNPPNPPNKFKCCGAPLMKHGAIAGHAEGCAPAAPEMEARVEEIRKRLANLDASNWARFTWLQKETSLVKMMSDLAFLLTTLDALRGKQ